MTVTSLNFSDIESVAEHLFIQNPIAPSYSYIDELHVTTMNPKLPVNYTIDLDTKKLGVVFESIKRLQTARIPVYFRLYNSKHLDLLAEYLGRSTLKYSMRSAKTYAHGVIGLDLDGVTAYYAPSSIWPAEGIFVDSNGAQRVAYAQSHSLTELDTSPLSKYTVQQLSPATLLAQAHIANVEQWSTYFMEDFLRQEIKLFSK